MASLIELEDAPIPHDISTKWILENQQLLNLEKPLKFHEFHDILSKRPLHDEFKVIEFMTQTTEHVAKLYSNPEQFSLNRYPEILTFQHSRVKLSEPVYINANYVQSVVKNAPPIIATQGPLSATLPHFWQMIFENNVSTIVMLCSLEQQNKVKCFRYWPCSLDQPELVLDKLTIKLISNHQIMPNLFKRDFVLIQEGQEKHELSQYQWRDWPDKEAPADWEPVSLLTHIAASKLINKQRLLVHCSAGVGRTGTFIAILNVEVILRYYKSKLENAASDDDEQTEPQISIFSLVRKLREQRWGMVHRVEQYEFIYKYLAKQIETRFQFEDSQ